MRIYTLIICGIISLCACRKKNTEKNSKPAKEPSTLTIVSEDKTYQLIINSEFSKFTDTAFTKIIASSTDMEVYLQGASGTHANGTGTYFLWCCGNKVFDKTSKLEYYAIKEPFNIGSYGTQRGSIEITKSDEKGYEGKFSFFSRISGVVKEFMGTFKVIY